MSEEVQAPTPAPAKETQGPVNNDGVYSLKLKSEFVLDSKPNPWAECPAEAAREASNKRDDTDNPNKNRNTKRKQKQNKGQKRPRDARLSNDEKVCLAVVRGDECPYGDKCRFSHDLKLYLKTRPEDIKVLGLEGRCPNFEERGYCMFGALCRMGACHLIKSTGENLKKEGVQPPPPIQNVLPKEVLLQLRKRKYPFKTAQKYHRTLKHQDVEQEKSQDAERKKEPQEEMRVVGFLEEETENDKEGKNSTDETKEDPNIETGNHVNKDKDETPEAVKLIHDPFRPSATPQAFNTTPVATKTKKIIDFSNKVYIAPLTTVGNLPFRRIMKKFGADITCGEMAVAGNLLEGKPSEWALLKRHPEEDIFGVQIASGYPDQFTRVAEVIESHIEIDFLDMNLGCPLDIICNKSAGASLMTKPNNLKGILAGVTKTLSCPVTIKMRTGWERENPFAHKLVKKIQGWGHNDGIAAIMVHGRSRLQRYDKLADWDYISSIYPHQTDEFSKLHVIGNGDIMSYTDYEERTSKEGISSCAMLARGALIKPWLPTEIKERRHWDISATERLDILKDYVKFGLTHWGSDQQGVDNTRRFLLEWLSFLCRYVPVGIIEGGVPQKMNLRPPAFMCGRSDLETLMLSPHSQDWIKIAEMLLGPVPEGFQFEPKHKARSYS